MNQRNLYICHTYYHLLVAIIKAIHSTNIESDLIVSTDYNNNAFLKDNKILERIRKQKIFKNVILIDYYSELNKFKNNKFKKFFFIKKEAKKYFDYLIKYNEIYIFNDTTIIGRMLIYNKIYYNYIEDGIDFLKNNYEKLIRKNKVTNFVRNVLGYPSFIQSKYIKSIEVNDKSNLKIKQKVIEVSKIKLINDLTDAQRKAILNIFFPNNLSEKDFYDATIIITQPLNEDNLLNSEMDKIILYKTIIKNYTDEEKIIIKTHPRELTNYKDYFNEYIVIDFPFPIEILNYLNIKLKKIVTLSSTSINTLTNTKEKIYLGWNWLEEFKKEKNI